MGNNINPHKILRLEQTTVNVWFSSGHYRILLISSLVIILGTSVYGLTIGLWRSPLQAFYVSLKLPLLIFLTTGCNAVLNWFVSLMIGAQFSFIRTLKYQLISYAIASIILLSFVPVSLFFLWSTPPLSEEASMGHSFITLLHVCLIAIAGVVANIKLFHLLRTHLPKAKLAQWILFSWLVGNMFLGCQLSWTLRPFIGAPTLEVQFFRPNPLKGNFYIDVYNKFKTVILYQEAR